MSIVQFYIWSTLTKGNTGWLLPVGRGLSNSLNFNARLLENGILSHFASNSKLSAQTLGTFWKTLYRSHIHWFSPSILLHSQLLLWFLIQNRYIYDFCQVLHARRGLIYLSQRDSLLDRREEFPDKNSISGTPIRGKAPLPVNTISGAKPGFCYWVFRFKRSNGAKRWWLPMPKPLDEVAGGSGMFTKWWVLEWSMQLPWNG